MTGYNGQPVAVTATINEHNFEAADTSIAVTRKLNGEVVYAAQKMDAVWSGNGDTRTAILNFTENGDYSFTITYRDKAGRNAVSYNSPEFTVDNDNPVLESNVSAENDNIANKGDVDFKYTYTDVNAYKEGITYQLTMLSGEVVNWTPQITENKTGGVNGNTRYLIEFRDDASSPALEDGIYILTVKVEDKAGHSESKTDRFSVNRGGSAYDYTENSYLKYLVESGYINSVDEDIQIQVANYDEITGYRVVVYNSLGEQIVLKEGEDYIWNKISTDEDGWNLYVCTIKKENFAENGTYSIVILTKDNADDSMYGENATLISNEDAVQTGLSKMTFTVDNVKPEVVLSGVKQRAHYDNDTDVKIDYSDANDIVKVVVSRHNTAGEKIGDDYEFSASEIESAGLRSGRLNYLATEYNGYQTITVSVTDVAQNTAEASVEILVTHSLWVQYINNIPAVVASIVGIVAVIVFIIILLAKKRKKKAEEAAKKVPRKR